MSLDQYQAMWTACLEEPTDHTVRGVFADLVEELGDADLAMLVRGPAGWMLVSESAAQHDRNLYAALGDGSAEARNTALREAIHSNASDDIGYEAKDLTDFDEVNNLMSQTNSTMWSVDDHHVTSTTYTPDEYRAIIEFSASGEHDEDRMFAGDQINGTATVVVRFDEERDRVAFEFLDVTAELYHPDDNCHDDDADPNGPPV